MSEARAKLSLDNAMFRTGLEEARNSVQKFTKDVGKMVAGYFAVTGIKSFFAELITGFDRVNDLALRFGENAETMQRIGGAGKMSGTDVEGLAKSLQKAGQNAEYAAEKGGDMQEAFEKLGIDSAKFVNLPMDQKLVALASGLEGISGNTEKVNVALQVMGKAGGESLPLLLQGATAVREQLAAIPVASNEAVAAIAQFNDELDALKLSAMAFFAPVVGFLGIFSSGLVALGTVVVTNVANQFIYLQRIMSQVFHFDFAGAKQSFKDYLDANGRAMGEFSDKMAKNQKRAKELISGKAGGVTPATKPIGAEDAEETTKAEQKKADEIAKLRASLAEQENEYRRKQLSDAGQLLEIEQDITAARVAAAAARNDKDEEGALKAKQEEIKLLEKRDALQEKIKNSTEADRKKAEAEQKTRADSIDSLKKEIAKQEFDRLSKEEQVEALKLERIALEKDLLSKDEETALKAKKRAGEIDDQMKELGGSGRGSQVSAGITADSLRRMGGGFGGVNYAALGATGGSDVKKQTDLQTKMEKTLRAIEENTGNGLNISTAEFSGF